MGDLSATDFSVVMLVFRVVFGLVFAGHGLGKRKGGIDGTAAWFDSMGMRPGRVHAQAASLTEIAVGLMLAVGLLTPLAAAGVVGVMVVAGWTTHRKNGFWIVSEGWEYTFMVALTAALIAAVGPGKYSLDHALDLVDGWNGLLGAVIAIGIGVVAGVGQLAAFYRPPEEAA